MGIVQGPGEFAEGVVIGKCYKNRFLEVGTWNSSDPVYLENRNILKRICLIVSHSTDKQRCYNVATTLLQRSYNVATTLLQPVALFAG